MIFSSTIFLFAFFPVFFFVLYQIPVQKIKWQNIWILLGSLFFYIWGAGKFFFVVLGTLVVDYALGGWIAKKRKYTKFFVALDVTINISILLYFKYFNFFFGNINAIVIRFGGEPLSFTRIALPLGISFVIFQKMTYCLDIAKGSTQPAKSYFEVLEYLLLFPQVIAGPIVKYNEVASELKCRSITKMMFLEGFRRFAIGLFKKVHIADALAQIADTAFAAQALGRIPFDYAWLGILAYTFQIYFDFSAYSDMAIGMLAMMGFHIPENFNHPYTAQSISDFWKRWHISMTSWFREYLYFPLGGNRKGALHTYLNLWIVFLASGFWHGASWNFVVWGLWHGSFLISERIFRNRNITVSMPKALKYLYTTFVVIIGWVFFRADNLQLAFSYIINLFDFGSYFVHVPPEYILTINPYGCLAFVLAVSISFYPLLSQNRKILAGTGIYDCMAHGGLYYIGVLILFYISALKIITGSASPFIYFKF